MIVLICNLLGINDLRVVIVNRKVSSRSRIGLIHSQTNRSHRSKSDQVEEIESERDMASVRKIRGMKKEMVSLEPLSEMEILAIGTVRSCGLPCIHRRFLLMASTAKHSSFLVHNGLRLHRGCPTSIVSCHGSHRVVVDGVGGRVSRHCRCENVSSYSDD